MRARNPLWRTPEHRVGASPLNVEGQETFLSSSTPAHRPRRKEKGTTGHLLSRRLLGAATAVAAAVGLAVVGAAPAWAAVPANDNFANAQTHSTSFTDSIISADIADATTEGSEPVNPSCVSDDVVHTVWYGLTVSAGTEISVDTIGSNYDTVLAVYTGPSLGSLSEVACNDDISGFGAPSQVEFTASSSTTYWIQAGGYGVGSVPVGDLDLNAVATPPAQACTIIGTNGNDTLTGTNGADVICGLGGNDTINGGNGNDTIYAGTGNDAVGGGNGSDTIYGGAGNDTNNGETLLGSLLHLFDNGNDTIDGGPGDDDLDGQNGDDTLTDHDGTDIMSGSNGSDNIDVQDSVGGDTANGGLGNDTCTADGGDTTNSC
jgi:Ca2+-binding RTX toxin-like protein